MSAAETCLSLVASPSPYVLPRVFDVLARQGVLPVRCHSQLAVVDGSSADAAITIDLHFEGVDDNLTTKLAHGLGRIVEVADVLIGQRCPVG